MQEQLLERLRERLGEQAPQSLRFRVNDAERLVTFMRDLQGFFAIRRPSSGGPNWYPYVNSYLLPRPCASKSPGGRGFL